MIKGEMTRLTMCTKCHKVGELEKIGFKSSAEMNFEEILKNIDALYDMPSELFEKHLNETLSEVSVDGGETLEDYGYELCDEQLDIAQIYTDSLISNTTRGYYKKPSCGSSL